MGELPLGIQLYTVREECTKDFTGTLKTIAEMGYQGVEFAWIYGDLASDELRGFLQKLGLKACGWHAPLEHLLDPNSETYTYARAIGSPYVTTSLPGEVESNWFATIDRIARAGAIAKEQGVTFTYHHHAQEFQQVEGQCALDLLLAKTSPETVKVELDTHWIKKGGEDPASYIRKYDRRIPQLHMKDITADNDFIEVGEGILDFPAIGQAAIAAGVKWLIVEQDVCKGPAIDSARLSIENLKKAGIV